MAAVDPALQRLGGRFLRTVPEGWAAALARHGQDLHLLPLAEAVASFGLPGDPHGALDLVRLALLPLVAMAEGHACLDLDAEVCASLAADFGTCPADLRALLASPAAAPLVGGPGARKPLVLEGGRLYAERLHRAEVDLAAGLLRRLWNDRAEALPVDPGVLAAPTRLSGEQAEAVRATLSRRLSLVTGGPGTGKTSIVVAVLRAALRAGVPATGIALAAPTGKAAHRMAAAIQGALGRIGTLPEVDLPLASPALAPGTLHRLLGFQAEVERFRHHPANPLPARLVVVDEASMIDLVLMERLLAALGPKARLVLLGDADQLPSVEPGSVFRDLVAGLPEATSRLTHSYRMDAATGGGAAILTAARRINGEDPADLWAGPHPVRSGDPDGPGVAQVDLDGPGTAAFLADWLARRVEGLPDFAGRIRQVHRLQDGVWVAADQAALADLFAHLDTCRILCPLKEAPGLRGSRGINAWLHGRVQAAREAGLEKRLAFSLGEPVMMTRNDYRREVFNGDQGLMLRVARDGGEARLEVVFPSAKGFRAFPAGPLLADLELAYALTVHKSQGSEFDRVAVVLPDQDHPLATREVLYTALTRARESVTILGGEEALRRAAGRCLRRDSGLGARLMAP